MYFTWSIIYFPLAVYDYTHNDMPFLKDVVYYFVHLFFVGEHYNSWSLWYLLSSVYAMLFIFFLYKKGCDIEEIFLIGLVVYLFGSYIDWLSYYAGEQVYLRKVQTLVVNYLKHGRIFIGMLYLSLGIYFSKYRLKIWISVLMAIMGYFFLFMGIQSSIAVVICSLGIFGVALNLQLKSFKFTSVLRHMSTSMFLIHLWVWTIFSIRVYGKLTYGLTPFVATTFISILISGFYSIYKINRNRKRVKLVNI